MKGVSAIALWWAIKSNLHSENAAIAEEIKKQIKSKPLMVQFKR